MDKCVLKCVDVKETDRRSVNIRPWQRDGEIGRPHWGRLCLPRSEVMEWVYDLLKTLESDSYKECVVTLGWCHFEITGNAK